MTVQSVIVWGTFCLIGGAGQLIYGIRNRRIFYPWSRARYTSDTAFYWMCMVGSVGMIAMGIGALIFGILH